MQIVIDIDENVFTRLFDNGVEDNEIAVNDVCEMAKAIRNGIPLDEVLDKIKSEIERQEKWLLHAGCTAYNVDIAFDAIKSAVAESEVRECPR